MSDQIEVPYGDNPTETAQNLLGAAARLGHAPYVIESTSRGVFLVPEDVATEAGDYLDRDGDGVNDGDEVPLDKLKVGELEKLAADESIDLEGAKASKATRVERIKEVRAQREANDAQVESLADGETADETTTDDDSNPAGDDKDQE